MSEETERIAILLQARDAQYQATMNRAIRQLNRF